MSAPKIQAILCDSDPWNAFGRWGPATVQYATDARGRNVFHGITPAAFLLIRVAVLWSRAWLKVYMWLEAAEQRQQARASAHRRRAMNEVTR